jgi:hypothetical protein
MTHKQINYSFEINIYVIKVGMKQAELPFRRTHFNITLTLTLT